MAGRTGYAQLSNRLWLNDKACELMERDPHAFAMWVMSLSYASDNLTDGVLTDRALRRLGCDEETCFALIESGMWEMDDHGVVRIHDYLKHNSSREQVYAERDGAAARQRRKRERDVTQNVTGDVTRDVPRDLNTKHKTQNQNEIDNSCCCLPESTNNARAEKEENNNNDDVPPAPTPIPADWTPDETDAAYAVRYRLDPHKTGRAFRDYHLRHGTTSHDWHAMFRGWCQRNPEAKPPPDDS